MIALVELLEDRTLLSGNVLVVVQDGDLVADGDGDNNSIEILFENGDLIVRGINGTTINGAATPFIAFADSDTVPDDLRISLGSGDNSARIAQGVHVGDDLIFNSGIGEDTVRMQDVTIDGFLSIQTSGGDDLVELTDIMIADSAVIGTAKGKGNIALVRVTVGDDLRISSSHDNDNVLLQNVTVADDVSIDTSRGDDVIGIENSDIGDDFKLRSGKGTDDVVVDNTEIADNTKLLTGRGDDSIVIRNSELDGKLKIDTSRDDDFVYIDPTTVTERVSIRTAGGDDTIVIDGANIFSGPVRVNGGSGTNAIDIDNANHFASEPTVRNANSTTVSTTTLNELLNDPEHGALARWIAVKDLLITSATNDSYSVAVNGTLQVNATNGVLANDNIPTGSALTAQLVTGPASGNLTLNPDGSFTYTPVAAFIGTVTFTYKLSNDSDQATATIIVDPQSLTAITSSNTTAQSNDTLITKNSSFRITGVTTPGALVEVARDDDNQFNDGSTTADASGHYEIVVTLVHNNTNHGAHSLKVRSKDTSNQSHEQTVAVHYAVGTVTRFNTALGSFDIELLDEDAPQTVANFLNLIDDFENSIVHRSVDGFVIQGGGFTFDATQGAGLADVPTVTPIPNEFKTANSNLAGTISMGLVANNPNSGTTQWFINTVNNTSLDNVPHAVFGRIIGTGLTVATAINDLTTYNLNGTFPEEFALATVPLSNYTPFTQNLTGTVTVAAGSNMVTGTGTSFTTQLQAAAGLTPGSAIKIGTQTFTVVSITDNTHLVISANHTAGATAVTAQVNAKPVAANFVRFSSIAEIL